MKKILAVLLAVMMLFATLSIGASAENYGSTNFFADGLVNRDQAVIRFVLNSGKITSGVWAYDIDSGSFDYMEVFEEANYYMIPDNKSNKTAQVAGSSILLPEVTAPSDWTFNGWADSKGQIYVGGTEYYIPSNAGGSIITLTADYSLAVPKEDEMGGIMDILVKVFGTIVGLLFFSDKHGSSAIEEGMQLMQKLLGSLFE